MNNSELLQMVAIQGEIAQKALLLQECGIIENVTVVTRVSTTSAEVSVILNQYSSTSEKRWIAEQKFFGEDQTLHADKDNCDALRKYVDEEIDKLQKKSQSVIDRIKSFVKSLNA